MSSSLFADAPRWHYGRGFSGTFLEDECPCGKAPCGLVDSDLVDPECDQHPMGRAKTIRQMYPADSCPRCRALGASVRGDG